MALFLTTEKYAKVVRRVATYSHMAPYVAMRAHWGYTESH